MEELDYYCVVSIYQYGDTLTKPCMENTFRDLESAKRSLVGLKSRYGKSGVRRLVKARIVKLGIAEVISEWEGTPIESTNQEDQIPIPKF